jgi:hypothetical protein
MACHDTMVDSANWWCHYILQNTRLELFDQFSDVLNCLEPRHLQEGSPLTIRLKCLAVWKELLRQTTPRRSSSVSSGDDQATTTIPPPLESRSYVAAQDKLMLLRHNFFEQDTAVVEEFWDVIQTIQVHDELSILYGKMKCEGDDSENVQDALDEALQKGQAIFYYQYHQVPQALQDIVVKENGFTVEQRMAGIVDVLNNNQSRCATKYLLLKTQLLLLHWCERRIPGGAPALVKSKYKGVGVVTRDPTIDSDVEFPAGNDDEEEEEEEETMEAATAASPDTGPATFVGSVASAVAPDIVALPQNSGVAAEATDQRSELKRKRDPVRKGMRIWTEAEDEKLMQAVQAYDNQIPWAWVAKSVYGGSRSYRACESRWHRIRDNVAGEPHQASTTSTTTQR